MLKTAIELKDEKVSGIIPLHIDGIEYVRKLQGHAVEYIPEKCTEILRLFSLVDMQATLNLHGCLNPRKKRIFNCHCDDCASVNLD